MGKYWTDTGDPTVGKTRHPVLMALQLGRVDRHQSNNYTNKYEITAGMSATKEVHMVPRKRVPECLIGQGGQDSLLTGMSEL